MFADQDWNLHLRDQHVNDKYFKDQHIWHLAPLAVPAIRREALDVSEKTGNAWGFGAD